MVFTFLNFCDTIGLSTARAFNFVLRKSIVNRTFSLIKSSQSFRKRWILTVAIVHTESLVSPCFLTAISHSRLKSIRGKPSKPLNIGVVLCRSVNYLVCDEFTVTSFNMGHSGTQKIGLLTDRTTENRFVWVELAVWLGNQKLSECQLPSIFYNSTKS